MGKMDVEIIYDAVRKVQEKNNGGLAQDGDQIVKSGQTCWDTVLHGSLTFLCILSCLLFCIFFSNMLQDRLTEKKEVCKEKNPEIFKESISSIQLNTVQVHGFEENIRGQRKELHEKIGKNSIWSSQYLEYYQFPSVRLENFIIP